MKIQNKQNKKFIKGFTLLELLVVVLIIGILAAIAIPKYQIVVGKAEFKKYQTIVSSLRTAYNDYLLVHNEGTQNFEELSITISSDFKANKKGNHMYKCVDNGKIFCCMSNNQYNSSYSHWESRIACGNIDLSIYYMESLTDSYGQATDSRGICLAQENNEKANKICASFGNKYQTAPGWAIPVINNYQSTSYNYYR